MSDFVEALYPAMRKRMALGVGDKLTLGDATVEVVRIDLDSTDYASYIMQHPGETGLFCWDQCFVDALLSAPPTITTIDSSSK